MTDGERGEATYRSYAARQERLRGPRVEPEPLTITLRMSERVARALYAALSRCYWAGEEVRNVARQLRSVLVVALVLVLGCVDTSTPHSWGDTAREVSETWCQRAKECAFFGTELDKDECVLHSRFHLCSLDGTCDVPVSDEGLDQCLADLALDECAHILYGLWPESCVQPLGEQP